MTLRHQLAALLVTFIWGTNFVLIKIGLEDFPPFLFVALRFAMVAFPLVLFLPRPKIRWSLLVSYGVLIGFGQFGLLFWAMQENISPGLAALVVQTQVFFTILLASLLYKETLKPLQILALFICGTGLALIVFQTEAASSLASSSDQTSILGIFVILIAAMSWAIGNIIVKQTGKVNIIAFLAWSSIFAIPPLFIMSWFIDGPEIMINSLQNASLGAWSILAWQAVGNTLLGYGLWNMLLGYYDTAKVTPWALLVPVFGLAASSLMLNETLPWWKLLAAALILAGLVLNILAIRTRRIISQ